MSRQNGFFVWSGLKTFKKYKISQQGQASMEYFILFIVLALFCLVGISKFFGDARQNLTAVYDDAVNDITTDQF